MDKRSGRFGQRAGHRGDRVFRLLAHLIDEFFHVGGRDFDTPSRTGCLRDTARTTGLHRGRQAIERRVHRSAPETTERATQGNGTHIGASASAKAPPMSRFTSTGLRDAAVASFETLPGPSILSFGIFIGRSPIARMST